MTVITDERCVTYSQTGHPERPERIRNTLSELRSQTELSITWGKPTTVDESVLLRAHTKEHLARLNLPDDFDADTPFFPGIADRARAGVGAALAALQAARAGETVFSLMRPPGHHATRNQAMGFCYLSTAAITVLHARATGAQRVAVYDFDVHHGNGTEDVLINQSGATFISIHQFPCYPGTGGRNVGDNCFNYPVPPNIARTDYRHVFESAFEQLEAAKPELVVVSAGFDAYARDPLAQETLEAEDYYWLGQRFRSLGLPIVSLLEGGYSDDLPNLIFSYLSGLEGE